MKTATPVAAALLAAALGLALYGCGGGGGGSPSALGPQTPTQPPVAQPPVTTPPDPPAPPPSAGVERLPFPFDRWCDDFIDAGCDYDSRYPASNIEALPDADIADARRSPVSHDWNRIFVGADQGTSHVGALPVVTHRGDAEIRFGVLNDGIGVQEIEEYLSRAAPARTVPDVSRVRVIGPSTREERNRVVAAVRMVNAALPESAKLDVDPARTGLSLRSGSSGGSYRPTGSELPNTIHVEFFDNRHPGDDRGGDSVIARDFGYVRIFDRAGLHDRSMILLLAHEIMHTLGFAGHAPDSFRSVITAMPTPFLPGDRHRPPVSALWPADREALRVLYGLDPADFGPWSSTSLHIHGNAPHAGFGVALRNGYAEPWAYGRLPGGDLRNNDALGSDANSGGSATWTGYLVGFTPDAEAVVGDAALIVDIAALTGVAAFSGLESWPPRQTPGEAGSGTDWGDGDLRYAIEAIGQTFRETDASEDAGRLTGVFTGPAHEGAAGTLERTDLTAAFGAARQ